MNHKAVSLLGLTMAIAFAACGRTIDRGSDSRRADAAAPRDNRDRRASERDAASGNDANVRPRDPVAPIADSSFPADSSVIDVAHPIDDAGLLMDGSPPDATSIDGATLSDAGCPAGTVLEAEQLTSGYAFLPQSVAGGIHFMTVEGTANLSVLKLARWSEGGNVETLLTGLSSGLVIAGPAGLVRLGSAAGSTAALELTLLDASGRVVDVLDQRTATLTHRVAAITDHVYWLTVDQSARTTTLWRTDGGIEDGILLREPLATVGAQPPSPVFAAIPTGPIVAHGDQVFFTAGSDLYRISTAGGSPTSIGTTGTFVSDMDVSEDWIALSGVELADSGTLTGRLLAVDRATAEVRPLAPRLSYLVHIVGDTVLSLEQSFPGSPGCFIVHRTELASGAEEILLLAEQPNGITIAGDTLYWGTATGLYRAVLPPFGD